jgi:(1->4)-alpha-D-glucan 1-alpha-D-glucosylmutase
MRWQQFTSPIMAKGHEDTALYIYNRLVSLNDVGGEPDTAGVSVDAFHDAIATRAEAWPQTMNATSTHDTKRSEDVRARINVLSELADEWAVRVAHWREINVGRRREAEGQPFPDTNTEYLIYQTLAGAWPFSDDDLPSFAERLKEYLTKATREAKVHTSWTNPNTPYEEAVHAFVNAILEDSDRQFLDDFRAFQNKVAWYGALNSLSQTLLKATSPGVPDFYQGTELWDFSLVDPDNRRPVDYGLRRQMMDTLATEPARLLAEWKSGAIKLHVTQRALKYRRDHRELFAAGAYIPLRVEGSARDHVVAFARHRDDDWCVTIAPRLYARMSQSAGLDLGQPPVGESVWGDTSILLPEGAPSAWHGVLDDANLRTSARIRVADALARLPIALLGG